MSEGAIESRCRRNSPDYCRVRLVSPPSSEEGKSAHQSGSYQSWFSGLHTQEWFAAIQSDEGRTSGSSRSESMLLKTVTSQSSKTTRCARNQVNSRSGGGSREAHLVVLQREGLQLAPRVLESLRNKCHLAFRLEQLDSAGLHPERLEEVEMFRGEGGGGEHHEWVAGVDLLHRVVEQELHGRVQVSWIESVRSEKARETYEAWEVAGVGEEGDVGSSPCVSLCSHVYESGESSDGARGQRA